MTASEHGSSLAAAGSAEKLANFFAREFTVTPCENGSFVIRKNLYGNHTLDDVWAFSSLRDLMNFIIARAELADHHAAAGEGADAPSRQPK